MSLLDIRSVRVLFTILCFVICLAFIYLARQTLMVFLFAIFFAYLLAAPVAYLQRRYRGSHSRIKAIITACFIVFGSITILVTAIGPRIVVEVQHLSQHLPELSERLSSGQLVSQVGTRRGWSVETQQHIQSLFLGHRAQIVTFLENALHRAAVVVKEMWWLPIVPILAIFFLKDGRKLAEDAVLLFKHGQRGIITVVLAEVSQMLGHFVRAQVTLSALSAGVITLFLVVMRMPYAYALGPIAGALEFIPIVGPLIGGATILAVGFAANYNHLVIVVLFLILWRAVQDYFCSPRILGDKLELHPLAVLFGVLAGGELGGVIGVFVSIPVMATLKIIWRTWQAYKSSQATGSAVVEVLDAA